jgi:hypothetical protein
MWKPRPRGVTRLLAAGLFAAALSTVALARPAETTIQISLTGGTFVTTCYLGPCYTRQWFCPSDQSNSWHLSVTGASPNSAVTLRRWHYEYNGYALRYDQEVGTTDENGEFQYSTTPAPPSDLGSYLTNVIIDGETSGYATYELGLGHC